MKRIIGIDIFRGSAIVLMIIFHIAYDLQYFNYLNLHITTEPFWKNFRLIIVNMFLVTVGMSLALAHRDSIHWAAVRKRTFQLALASLLVSVSTYMIFPHSWVYFGILHFILLASLLALPFIHRPWLSLALSVIILIAYFHFGLRTQPLFDLLAIPLGLPLKRTVDLVQIIPWISTVLIGISIVGFNLHHKLFDTKLFNAESKCQRSLVFMGKHALIIYLIHQPLLFGLFYLGEMMR